MAKKKPIFVDWCADDALQGMEMLEPLEELAYRRLIDFIYSTNDQLIDDEARLSRMTKTGKKWKAIRKILIDLKKIEIVERPVDNGVQKFIVNQKCTAQLIAARSRIEQKSLAGKISVEKRKSLNNNETGSTDVATAEPRTNQLFTTHHPPPCNKQ